MITWFDGHTLLALLLVWPTAYLVVAAVNAGLGARARRRRQADQTVPRRTRLTCQAQSTYRGTDVPLYCDSPAGHYPRTPHTDPNAWGTSHTGFWWEGGD